jgi:hypothetical protein
MKIVKIKKTQLLTTLLTLSTAFFLLFAQVSTLAQTFSKQEVFRQKDLYSLPRDFASPQDIQKFLESKNSLLATYKVNIGLYTGGECKVVYGQTVCYDQDRVSQAVSFPGVSQNLQPQTILQNFNGTQMGAADFIWNISRTNMVNGCSLDFQNSLCFENNLKPINPAFVLSLIQKESRLIYGACARSDADTNPACTYSSPTSRQKIQFRLDRATGYYCFETQDKTKSCWDENPKWLAHKGFFRQVYHAIRSIRLRELACEKGGIYSFKNTAGDFKVGNTVRINGEQVYLSNGITCALYVYTPHFWGNQLHWLVMKDLNGFYDYRDKYNLPENYKPKPLAR